LQSLWSGPLQQLTHHSIIVFLQGVVGGCLEAERAVGADFSESGRSFPHHDPSERHAYRLAGARKKQGVWQGKGQLDGLLCVGNLFQCSFKGEMLESAAHPKKAKRRFACRLAYFIYPQPEPQKSDINLKRILVRRLELGGLASSCTGVHRCFRAS